MHDCLAEMRPAGSYTSICSSRSRPLSSRFVQRGWVSSRTHFGNEVLKSGKQVLSETPGHSASVGVPRRLHLLGWTIKEETGRTGRS